MAGEARRLQPGWPVLFYALWPDEAVRDALAEWGRTLQQSAGGRATRPDNLHMTLAYLGRTDPERVAEAAHICRSLPFNPFGLTLDKVDWWKHNQIAWAGCRSVSTRLEHLVADLRGALDQAGFRFEPKSFFPHITLARKAQKPAATSFVPVDWEVRRVVLFETVPGPGGVRYAVRAETPRESG
jgi:RNA 2',3'-cyclic 3'-phosphodiesterase